MKEKEEKRKNRNRGKGEGGSEEVKVIAKRVPRRCPRKRTVRDNLPRYAKKASHGEDDNLTSDRG